MEQMWFEETFRWHVLVAQEVPLDLFVVPGDHDGDREAQATVWKRVRHEITNDTRTYSQWLAGADRRELRGDARRDQIREREEAHQRCQQG